MQRINVKLKLKFAIE